MRVCAAGLLLAGAALAAFAQGTAPTGDRFIFEPTPEAPDAAKLGASEVEKTQREAKTTKDYAGAARKLEGVARKWPASIHDCNLALAYLRAGLQTQAQLAWDLALLRNGARPKWCTGDVSTQISQALRGASYVPVAIDVVPADALVEVNGAAFRNMRTVWLPPTPATVTVSAPGLVTKTLTVSVAPPNARVAVTLEPPPPPVVQQPDAGVVEPMASPDAGVATPPPAPDAAVAVQPPPPENTDALIRIGGSPLGYRAAALSLAAVGWIGAGFFGYMTYAAKTDANERYSTDPAFDDARKDYKTYAGLTLGSAILGALSTGVYVYFLTREDKVIPKPGKLDVSLGADGSFGVGYSGTFGGGK